VEKIPSLLERDHTTGAKSAPLTGQIAPGTEWVFTDDEVIARRKWDGTAVLFTRIWPHTWSLCLRSTLRDVDLTIDPETNEGTLSPPLPRGFIPAEYDGNTRKLFGWQTARRLHALQTDWRYVLGPEATVTSPPPYTGKPLPEKFALSHIAGTTEEGEFCWSFEKFSDSGFHEPLHEALVASGTSLREGTYELVGPKINGNPGQERSHRLERHDIAESVPAEFWKGGIEQAAAAVQRLALVRLWEGLVFYHPDGRRAKLKARDVAELHRLEGATAS